MREMVPSADLIGLAELLEDYAQQLEENRLHHLFESEIERSRRDAQALRLLAAGQGPVAAFLGHATEATT